jgi:hypothetical protein
VLTLGLVVTALLYVGFALAGDRQQWLMTELLGFALFGSLAWLGLRVSPWWLALGWMGHVAWDVGLHLDQAEPLIGAWYPLFCVGFDLVVGGFLINAALGPARPRREAA